jgi:hypothetical protein
MSEPLPMQNQNPEEENSMVSKKPEKGTELDVKPTSQLDLERRLGEDPPNTLFKTVNPVESTLTADDNTSELTGGDDGDLYVGTDPIYQNHANDTEKPLQAEEGPDKSAEDFYLDTVDSEGGTEAGDQLKEAYGAVTPNVQSEGSTVTEAQAESTDSTNEKDAAASDDSNKS